MLNRVSFLVDGFNLYHSLRQVEQLSGARVRWLDLRRLCANYLQAVRGALGEKVELAQVHYFSALATHLTPTNRGVVNRHSTYISVLESTGVQVVLSRFKAKDMSCPACGHAFKPMKKKRPTSQWP